MLKHVSQEFAKCRAAANWKGIVVRECVVSPKDEIYQLSLEASVPGLCTPKLLVVCEFVCLDFVPISFEVGLVLEGDKYKLFYRTIPHEKNTLLQCVC